MATTAPAAPSQSDIQAAANYYGVPVDVIDQGIVDSYKAELYQADQQAANGNVVSTPPAAYGNPWNFSKSVMDTWLEANPNDPYTKNLISSGIYTPAASTTTASADTVGTLNNLTKLSDSGLYNQDQINTLTDAINKGTLDPSYLTDSVAKASDYAAEASATNTANLALSNSNNPSAALSTGDVNKIPPIPAVFDSEEDYNDYTYGGKDFNSEFSPSLTNDQLAIAQQQQADDLIKNTITTPAGTVKPSDDTIAKLDTGSVVDDTKINTQGGLTTSPPAALTTGDVNKITTTGGAALTTGDVNKITTSPPAALTTGDVNALTTSPAATSSPNTMNTGSIPALTTADLAAWGKTLPQGITADQLTAALKTQQDTLNKSYSDALAGNQTALTSQNEAFLKNWSTSADGLKNSILSGVDTKNQAFGVDATKGFMNAFKNFQIPTNQQTGVNLGNYNDNRNAAADQWWSQYVTGRR